MTSANFEFIHDEDLLKKIIDISDDDINELKELYQYLQEIRPLKEKILKKAKCKRCGECCKFCNAMLTKQDIIRLCKYLKCDFEELYDKYMDKNARVPYLKLPCPFLNDNNECDVYRARPSVCREFPFNEFFLIVSPCPLGKELRQIYEDIRQPISGMNEQLQVMADERHKLTQYMMNSEHVDTRKSVCMVIHKEILVELLKVLKENRKRKEQEIK